MWTSETVGEAPDDRASECGGDGEHSVEKDAKSRANIGDCK
jgi:hypothetical protein